MGAVDLFKEFNYFEMKTATARIEVHKTKDERILTVVTPNSRNAIVELKRKTKEETIQWISEHIHVISFAIMD